MQPVRPLTITALALAAALSLPACSSGEPAQPAPPAAADPSTTVPQPTAEPAIAFTDVALQSDVVEAFGAQIVLVRGDTRGLAILYSLAQQNPVTIALDIEPDEAVEGVSWAVEQDQDAEPLAVALVYITTEASGLNATADKIQMRVYDDTGTELSRTDLPSDVTGTPYEPGDFGGAKPSRYLTVMNGTAVFTTELANDTYAVLGYNVASATEKWRTVGPEEPERTGAPLENGWVALDWQDALTAFDPATGNTQWRSEQMSSVYAHGDAPFLTSYASPAAWSGPDPVDFIDGATGAIMSIPDGFTNYDVDPITGESAFLWFASDSSPADKPGLLVRSAEGADVFTLDAQKTGAAGVQDILAMWDGLIWVETSAGKDVVVAATGARAPTISGGGEVFRIPEYATPDWTITTVDGGTFGDDTRILTRHPGGDLSLETLSVQTAPPSTT